MVHDPINYQVNSFHLQMGENSKLFTTATASKWSEVKNPKF